MARMTRLSEIQTLHWSPRLGGDGVVENIDDLHQVIRIILGTPKGADPLRPDFGSNLHRYIDYPIDRARPHVVREAIEAIRRWETRLTVLRVVVEVVEVSTLRIRVLWKIDTGIQGETEVKL